MDVILQFLLEPLFILPIAQVMDSVHTVVALWRFFLRGLSPVAHFEPTRTLDVPMAMISCAAPSHTPGAVVSPSSSWSVLVLKALVLVLLLVSYSVSRSVAS